MSDPIATTGFTPQLRKLLDDALALKKATNIDHLLGRLADEIVDYFDAECVRLFEYDAVDNEVYTRVKLSGTLIELKFQVTEKSLAGYTALHKKVVTLDDVRGYGITQRYPGLQYDARYEDRAGVRMRSIISAPLLEKESDLIGIIQLVNTKRPVKSYKGELDLLVHIGKLVADAIFQHDEQQHRRTKFDLLLEEGLIGKEQIDKATRTARKNAIDPLKGDPVNVLMDAFGVPTNVMQASLARYYLTDFLPFDEDQIIPPDIFKGFNPDYFRYNFAIPIELQDNTIMILLDDPFNATLIQELKKTYQVEHCQIFVGFRRDILRYIDKFQDAAGNDPAVQTLAQVLDTDETEKAISKDDNILDEKAPPVVQFVNGLILDAYRGDVSDIHIEPGTGDRATIIRFRRDSVCFKHTQVPATLSPVIINRIKVMSGLRLEEHRFPQSGKIRLKYGDSVIELRVEVTPTVGGKRTCGYTHPDRQYLSEYRRSRFYRGYQVHVAGDDRQTLRYPAGLWPHRSR